ncbi:hypothetical protein F5Y01DRAFT_278942 [Xylaria sp. FL0043]|nr:hypothetical protein F5Y01DRAFT_278942 [Xylaria sp. FL0043]
MNSVPVEIVYAICSRLSVDDILNFRLVNKLFADVGAAYMLPEVTFYMHRDDLDRLKTISLHPIFSRHVTSLTYFAGTLDSPQVSWREFVQDHKRRMRWDGKLRKANATPTQLMAEYRRYSDAVDEQDKLMEGRRDLDLLKEVLPRFPRLKELTMSAGNLFYEKCYHTRRKKPFSEFLETGYMGGAHPEGKRQMDALLRANAHSPCALTSFRAGSFHWRFFKRSERELTRMFKPLASLTSIELCVSVDPADERVHEGNSLRKCQRVLAKGGMRSMFQHTPRLESLWVEILGLEYDTIEKGAAFRDLIAPGFHWPHLKELVLGGFAGDRTEIMNALLLHKNTLRKLCLRDVTLTSTSWRKLLPDIRRNLHLEEACICGDIYGLHEHDSDAEGSWINDPTNLPLEYWGLSVPEIDADDMRDSINMYCRQGGEKYPDEVPLSRDVVNRYYREYVRPYFENDEYSDEDDEDGDDSDDFGLNASDGNWEDVSDVSDEDDEDDEDEDMDDDDDEGMNGGEMGVFTADMPMEQVIHMVMDNMAEMQNAVYYDDDEEEEEGDDDDNDDDDSVDSDDTGMFDQYDDIDLNVIGPHSLDPNLHIGGSTAHHDIDSDDEMPDLAS